MLDTFTPRYVKVGIAGYGPDLHEEDEPYDDVQSVCEAIRYELADCIDMLAEDWIAAKVGGDAEHYMAARELADSLETLRANLDYDKRIQAPLYAGRPESLDATMLATIDATFPLTVDTYGTARLYVWEASE